LLSATAAISTIRWLLLRSLGRLRRGGGDSEGRGWSVGWGDLDIGIAGGQDNDREDGHCAKSGTQADPIAELTDQLLHRASPILAIDNDWTRNSRMRPDLNLETRILRSGDRRPD
jgi:hypothetical protein